MRDSGTLDELSMSSTRKFFLEKLVNYEKFIRDFKKNLSKRLLALFY
jgi:hypothetical protein